MSTGVAPNYKISGSIYATNAKAEHNMAGQKFTATSTGTMDLTSTQAMNVKSLAGTVDVQATELGQKLIIGVRNDAAMNFPTALSINGESNTRLLTGSGYANQRQALYYAGGDGRLQMLENVASDDSIKQMLTITTAGDLQWVDAEAASLKCLGMTSTYTDANFKTSGDASLNAGVLKVEDLDSGAKIPKGVDLTISSKTTQGGEHGVTGTSRLTNGAGDASYVYFRAHQGGQYQINVQADFFNQFYDSSGQSWEADVSGDRTLEIWSKNIIDASFTNGIAVDQGSDLSADSWSLIETVTSQPNPDSSIPTPVSLSFSHSAAAKDMLVVRLKANVDKGFNAGAYVQAVLRKFDVHYICD